MALIVSLIVSLDVSLDVLLDVSLIAPLVISSYHANELTFMPCAHVPMIMLILLILYIHVAPIAVTGATDDGHGVADTIITTNITTIV